MRRIHIGQMVKCCLSRCWLLSHINLSSTVDQCAERVLNCIFPGNSKAKATRQMYVQCAIVGLVVDVDVGYGIEKKLSDNMAATRGACSNIIHFRLTVDAARIQYRGRMPFHQNTLMDFDGKDSIFIQIEQRQ